MKRLTIALVAGMLLAVGASSAEARVPRLHYYEAYDAAQQGTQDAYFDTSWAVEYGATDCFRTSRIKFLCEGFISGDLGTFGCTSDYSSCSSTQHYCDVNIRVRSGYRYNFYNAWLSGCTSYQQTF